MSTLTQTQCPLNQYATRLTQNKHEFSVGTVIYYSDFTMVIYYSDFTMVIYYCDLLW